MVKQSLPTLPILIMFTKDPDVANGLVASAAAQRNIKLTAVGLSDDVASQSSQLQVIERLIADAMTEVRFTTIVEFSCVPFSILQRFHFVDYISESQSAFVFERLNVCECGLLPSF